MAHYIRTTRSDYLILLDAMLPKHRVMLAQSRILKVSGVPVFPSQIEDSISQVPGVRLACVIGVPHPYKMQVAKAFVVKSNPAEDPAARP